MNREEVLDSIRANVENENLIKHMRATEAIMRILAKRLDEDEEEWGLTGLLHDIDLELIGGDMSEHSKLGADLAKELGASEAMAHAILCHNSAQGIPPETRLDKALFCVNPLTVLIVAATLARPDKKLAHLKADSVINKFKKEDFAPEVNREEILQCSQIGLELGEFIELGLESMRGIATELGL